MNRITDSKGNALVPGCRQRVKRLHANGKHVRGGTSYVVDVHLDDQGRAVVDYEELVSLKRGTVLAERTQVLYSNPKNPTRAEKQYKVDKEASAAVSKRVSKRRGGLLR